MIISSCDECDCAENFKDEREQRLAGWTSKNNYVRCLNCRLMRLEYSVFNKIVSKLKFAKVQEAEVNNGR